MSDGLLHEESPMYSFDLESFTKKYLRGDVRNLAKLSLGWMQVLPHQYDFPLMDHMDCDDTDFSWEIYNRIWGIERMPESPPLDIGMIQPEWRGDTINSFRTLFGYEITESCVGGDCIVGFKGLRRFGVEKELYDKVHEFWYTYHCIGNFIPLPNARVGNKTINTFRTTWHDYFDAFLENLHSCLVYGGQTWIEGKASLPALIHENSFFWDEYRGKEGWEKFITNFLLEGYCDEYLRPKKLYAGFWHWQHHVSRSDYVRACHEYIDVATANIHTRGERMMEIVSRTMPSGAVDS